MNDKTVRHHHWIPRFYLKRFTNTGLKDGKLTVLDVQTGKKFQSSPNGVGAGRDFNRIDVPDHPPDAIEKALSPLEGEMNQSIGRTVKAKAFSQNKDANLIFNLIALIAVRNPRFREQRRDFMERISEAVMDLTLATPERYESAMRRAQKDGALSNDRILPYETMVDFHQRKEYTVEMAREAQIGQEFELMDPILKTLGARSWSFIHCKSDVGAFVTSDHPVLLRPNRPTQGPYRLGFGLRIADVVFPLSKRLCLIGSFGADLSDMEAFREQVALINSEIMIGADRQIYAPNENVPLFCHRTKSMSTLGTIAIQPLNRTF